MNDSDTLRERIARLSAHLAVQPVPDFASGAEDVQSEISGRSPEAMIGPESVGAEERAEHRGRYWFRRVLFDPSQPWGETCCSSFVDEFETAMIRVPLDGSSGEWPLNRCLFVDCETTGLSGGAGTIAFLTAVGQLVGDRFAVDQYFLADPADEAAVLDTLAARFASADALVTYNGSGFDLPLLEGRFRLWRLDPSFRELPHHDLLWPTRSLFKHRMGECSLGNVEARLLKYARVEDLPGSQVPQVYFQFLREGFSPRLHTVFEHNRLDVVSLFVYALWLNGQTQHERPMLSDPDDLAQLALYWFRRRLTGPALVALDAAGQRVLSHSQRARLYELRARIHKYDHRYDDAHTHWEQLNRCDPACVDAAEEMAKHLEHRQRDYAAALTVVDRALATLRLQETLNGTGDESTRQRLMHRRARLQRRLAQIRAT